MRRYYSTEASVNEDGESEGGEREPIGSDAAESDATDEAPSVFSGTIGPDGLDREAGENSAAGEGGDEGEDDGGLDIPLPWNTIPSDDDADETDDADSAGESTAEDEGGGERRETAADPDCFQDLHFVGPKTAALLRDSEISLTDFLEKRIAYRDLTAAGVNPGVAAKIRREHSLSWSLDGGGTDLGRRSSQVRGLDDDERAWIAASSGWSDDEAETDGSGDGTAGEAAWREQTASGDDTVGRTTDRGVDDGSSATDGEAAWRAGGSDDLLDSDDGGSENTADTGGDGSSAARDAESAWRRQSAPTPLTAVDGLDEEAAATLHRAGIGSVRRLTTADLESVADALDVDRERVESWYRLAREHES